MRIRTRKLIGTIGLLTLVTAWALVMMGLAQFALRAQSGCEIFHVVIFFLIAWLVCRGRTMADFGG